LDTSPKEVAGAGAGAVLESVSVEIPGGLSNRLDTFVIAIGVGCGVANGEESALSLVMGVFATVTGVEIKFPEYGGGGM